jgi:hypothetical protein
MFPRRACALRNKCRETEKKKTLLAPQARAQLLPASPFFWLDETQRSEARKKIDPQRICLPLGAILIHYTATCFQLSAKGQDSISAPAYNP